jgi:hypothetical protein
MCTVSVVFPLFCPTSVYVHVCVDTATQYRSWDYPRQVQMITVVMEQKKWISLLQKPLLDPITTFLSEIHLNLARLFFSISPYYLLTFSFLTKNVFAFLVCPIYAGYLKTYLAIFLLEPTLANLGVDYVIRNLTILSFSNLFIAVFLVFTNVLFHISCRFLQCVLIL